MEEKKTPIRYPLTNDYMFHVVLQRSTESSLYYLCRSFTSLNRGDYYETANPTVHIGILDFNLAADNPYFFSQYRFLNTETFQPYDDKLSIYVIELNKLKNGCNEEHKEIYHWAQLFKAQTWEELDMIEKNHPECGEFVAVLKELNEDEMMQLECEAREMYEKDLHAYKRAALREGIEQGLERGRTEGEFFNIISLTKKKIEKNKTATIIAEELEADISLIEQIAKIISELPVYTVEGVYEKLKRENF